MDLGKEQELGLLDIMVKFGLGNVLGLGNEPENRAQSIVSVSKPMTDNSTTANAEGTNYM